MEVRLVVFDMAGTTVFDGDAVHRCLMESLRHLSVEITRDEANAVMGWPKPVAIRHLLETHAHTCLAADDDCVMRAYEDFEGQMLSYYQRADAVREIAGATGTFAELKQRGVFVALDTGFSRAIADAIVESLGWQRDGLIDTCVTSDDVPQGRPYPDMIFKAMDLTGVSNALHVAKVGDTPSDLQEGIAAGCGWVVGVTSGSHSRAQLEEYPHTHLVDSIIELPDLILRDQKRATMTEAGTKALNKNLMRA